MLLQVAREAADAAGCVGGARGVWRVTGRADAAAERAVNVYECGLVSQQKTYVRALCIH